MKSFDHSLKYLLQHDPAEFIRFGLGDPSVHVLGPVASGLPARGRDVDGGYLIARGGAKQVAHIEFHRRHQAADELAVDVAEAQVRLFRRERVPVLSLVWDLYAGPGGPFVEERKLRYGAALGDGGSEAMYLRVSLRSLGWRELLARAPAALWPLVALTHDGATEEAVHGARDAIEGRGELSEGQRADHLAVLWFVAEAEQVPVWVMQAYISEKQLMASTLYDSIFEKGERKMAAETIVRLLTRRLGDLDPDVRERIRAITDTEVLMRWYDEALLVLDAEAARQLVERMRKALLQ